MCNRQLIQIAGALALLATHLSQVASAQQSATGRNVLEWLELEEKHWGPPNSRKPISVFFGKERTGHQWTISFNSRFTLAEYSRLAGLVGTYDRLVVTLSSDVPMVVSLEFCDPFNNKLTELQRVEIVPEQKEFMVPLTIPISPEGEGLANGYSDVNDNVRSPYYSYQSDPRTYMRQITKEAHLNVSAHSQGTLRIHHVAIGKSEDILKQRQAWDGRKRTVLLSAFAVVAGAITILTIAVVAGCYYYRWGRTWKALHRFPRVARRDLLKQVKESIQRIAKQGCAGGITFVLRHGVPEVAGVSQTPSSFQSTFLVLEALATKLGSNRELVWTKIRGVEFAKLAKKAIRLSDQGIPYSIEVWPETGHYEQVCVGGPAGDPIYESQYAMDSPQTIRISAERTE